MTTIPTTIFKNTCFYLRIFRSRPARFIAAGFSGEKCSLISGFISAFSLYLRMEKYNELIGLKKSKLTVIDFFREIKYGKTTIVLNCQCDCGKPTKKTLSDFRKQDNVSCGCLKGQHNFIDGRKKMIEYKSYRKMLDRCFNPNDKDFKHYGGRGITVCDRWKNDFANFIADMGAKPTNKHSIDRKNNDGNYEPGNCKWSTMKEQNNNKRNNIKK